MERRDGKYYFYCKDIFEQEFGREVVDIVRLKLMNFWTTSSRTMKLMLPQSKSLRQEIAELKEELSRKPESAPVQAEPLEMTATTSMTNFDILKRLNRLEKEVFGKQILDNSDL